MKVVIATPTITNPYPQYVDALTASEPVLKDAVGSPGTELEFAL